uniref:Uncharacterized protein n=1 Tax=Arundo donax TaxID=35708 RepID=A0A0A9H206_ARUDO
MAQIEKISLNEFKIEGKIISFDFAGMISVVNTKYCIIYGMHLDQT